MKDGQIEVRQTQHGAGWQTEWDNEGFLNPARALWSFPPLAMTMSDRSSFSRRIEMLPGSPRCCPNS